MGTGRVADSDRRADRQRVIGIDVSARDARAARRTATPAGVTLDLRHGDMRELALDQTTDLVICPFRSSFISATTRRPRYGLPPRS